MHGGGLRQAVALVLSVVALTGCGTTARLVASDADLVAVETAKRINDLKKAQAEFEDAIEAAITPTGDDAKALAIARFLSTNRHNALTVAGALAQAPASTLLASLQTQLVRVVVTSGERDASVMLEEFRRPAEARRRWAELESAEEQLQVLRGKLKQLATKESLSDYLRNLRDFAKQVNDLREKADGSAK